MKKTTLLMGISALLVVGTIGVAATTFAKKALHKAVGYDDPYTITINAEDVTTSTSAVTGSYVAHTDQLGNPVTFNYANIKYEQVGEDKYLVFEDDSSWFANDKDWQIRNMDTITVYGDGTVFTYDYGWELQAGAIAYTEEDHYDWANGTDISAYNANYFRIEHRETADPVKVSKIVFTYGKECTAGENPYIVSKGVKYEKCSTYASAVGFSKNATLAQKTNVVIEDTVGGLPVQKIDAFAFSYESTIETIDLGAYVRVINNNAIQYCTNLTAINGLNHVEYFYNHALQNCTSLTGDLIFGDEIEYIGSGAFMYTGFSSVSFPESCNPDVCDYSFRFMPNLASFHIGAAMTKFYDDLYSNDNLATITVGAGNTKYSAVDNVLYQTGSHVIRIAQKRAQTSFTLPDDIDLSAHCGAGAVTLETLVLNDQIDNIPYNAFLNCTSLNSITFGSHANLQISYAFLGCSALESITIPSNVAFINQWAFSGCTNLKTVIFEDGCTELGRQVFKDCTKLEKVLLPSTLLEVGYDEGWGGSLDVFDGCTKLTKVLTRLEDGESYTGTFPDGWLGGRTLVKHSETIKDASHWRMHPTYGPQAWKTTITFKTDYGTSTGQGMFMSGTFNDWAQSTSYRMTYADGIWSLDIELDTCTDTPYEFKCFRADYDNPASNQHWEIENHSYTFMDVDTEYWCTNF